MTKEQHKTLAIGLSYGMHKTCKDLHHSKSERHEYTQKCPAEARHQLEMDAAYKALQILARDIQTDDGVVNACLIEAASRLQQLQRKLNEAIELAEELEHELEIDKTYLR